jgi:hypothetical protein
MLRNSRQIRLNYYAQVRGTEPVDKKGFISIDDSSNIISDGAMCIIVSCVCGISISSFFESFSENRNITINIPFKKIPLLPNLHNYNKLTMKAIFNVFLIFIFFSKKKKKKKKLFERRPTPTAHGT